MGPVGGRYASVATQTISEMTNNNLLLLCPPKARRHIRKNGNRSSRLVFLLGGMLSLTLGVQVHSVLNWLNN